MPASRNQIENAISKIRERGIVPETDFTQHRLKDGRTVSTKERFLKDVEAPTMHIPTADQFFSKEDPTKPDVNFLKDHFYREGRVSEEQALYILEKATDLLKQDPNLVSVDAPVTVCGNIHGHYRDLVKVLEIGGNPATTRYLFLGDYVDRGHSSIECVLCLWALKIWFPATFFLLRGHHECREVTDRSTFKLECKRKYSERIYEACVNSFCALPLAAITAKQLFCVHGGISPELHTLDDIRNIGRFNEPPTQGLMCDILWSDPAEDFGWDRTSEIFRQNHVRGRSYFFTYLAAKRFLETNQLLSIVRAHQVQSDGYRAYRKLGVSGLPSVITLSSCQHHRHSRASVLQYKNKGLSIRRFNPKADPYQLPDFMDAFAWSLPFVGNQFRCMLLSLLHVCTKEELEEEGEGPAYAKETAEEMAGTPTLYSASDSPTPPGVGEEKEYAQLGTCVPDPSTSGILDDSPADREVGSFQGWEEGMGEVEGDEVGAAGDLSSASQQDITLRVEVTIGCDDKREQGVVQDANDPASAPISDASILVGLDGPAWKRIASRAFLSHEVVPLIEATLMSQDEVKTIGNLCGDDAQNFIDVIHEALNLPDLRPQLRRKLLRVLCRICGRQGLLPKSLQIPLSYNRSDTPLYHGGYADVWKGEHRGCHVAVKVLRVYSTSNLDKVTTRFCKEVVTWNALRHPNVLPLVGVTMSSSQFEMVSEWMVNGNINEFIKAHREANRFELLKDVATGLIYMHGQAMIHGDLKGANILIDEGGHARLADFGLLTIVSDPTNFMTSGSLAVGGTTRWMSPELLHPDQFGFEDSRPTKDSDCYALGMVIYEVLSGQTPFTPFKDFVVMRKVVDGERPARPEGAKGAWFTDDLWVMMELCWATQPDRRPNIATAFKCLEQVSKDWTPHSPQVEEKVVETDEEDWHFTLTN